MSSDRVVEGLDVLEDLAGELAAGGLGLAMDEFLLQCGEEALGDGVVKAVAAGDPIDRAMPALPAAWLRVICRSREHADFERARLALEAAAYAPAPPGDEPDGATKLASLWPVWVADARARIQPETVDQHLRVWENRVRPAEPLRRCAGLRVRDVEAARGRGRRSSRTTRWRRGRRRVSGRMDCDSP